mmetsp:Transcript_8477/g.29927  ORF Transcript_8477/g.29927 Transcript_8477/m.29927 type:complete len:351 (-) Transcript_8477:61-1113(-)
MGNTWVKEGGSPGGPRDGHRVRSIGELEAARGYRERGGGGGGGGPQFGGSPKSYAVRAAPQHPANAATVALTRPHDDRAAPRHVVAPPRHDTPVPSAAVSSLPSFATAQRAALMDVDVALTDFSEALQTPPASPHGNSQKHIESADKPPDKVAVDLVDVSPPLAEDEVPTVFRWEHGGRQVFVTGTFNNWSKQMPMHRSGNDFTYIHNLTKGQHAYRFVVDDEWRFAPDQQTVADVQGRINNFIDVSQFDAYTGDETFLHRRTNDAGEVYSRKMPDLDDYTKAPPPLPPHLRHIILNKSPPTGDANALPHPQHVALNHLYCTAIKDGMMVLGVTIRYRQHACTTVYYSCS